VFPVLTFSTVDWYDVWHRPQAVMSRLAGDGCPVLYVDTLGLRTPRPRDLARILARLRNAVVSSNGALREPVPGVRVLSPLLLPFLDSCLARKANVRWLVPRLRRHLNALGGGDPVVWVYLPTKTVLDCVKAIPRRLLVYESIDALASNPAGVSRDFHVAEREILTTANLVITSSETLRREKAAWNANTHHVAPGVDDEFFAPRATPGEIAALPTPRVGFFGTIDHRLDLELMRRLAERYRSWSFVLIGPARVDLSALTSLANVHWLGPKQHAELPGYVSGLDAVFLPYVTDDFTRHIYPAKIHECLALGLPVVATVLPSLEPFEGLIRLVRPGQSFGEELESSLQEDDRELRGRRVDVARASSWNVRYAQIRQLVDAALASQER
jgi:glycosyltransferase involved in cell wall biosynthesis